MTALATLVAALCFAWSAHAVAPGATIGKAELLDDTVSNPVAWPEDVKKIAATQVLAACRPERHSSSPVPPSLTLVNPLPMQVMQRHSQNEGMVQVAGSASVAVKELRCRVTGQPLEGKLPDGWHPLPVDAITHGFHGDIRLPAGGWYRLEVEGLANGQVLARSAVEQFGVGEVFIVAGQSNAGNYGSEKQRTKTGLVAEFDGDHWNVADDPQKGAGGDGGSFMPSFGDALVKRFGVPIGLVPVAAGGTSVREWLPKGIRFKQNTTTSHGVIPQDDGFESNGILFDKLTKPMKALGVRGFRAVLWHQGESDAGQARGGYPADRQISGAQYMDFMEKLILSTRSAAAWPVPWFTAVATYHSETDAGDDEFRSAMRLLWNKGMSRPGPDTDTLRGDLRAGVHFNGKGLQKHGELWADKIGPWLETMVEAP